MTTGRLQKDLCPGCRITNVVVIHLTAKRLVDNDT